MRLIELTLDNRPVYVNPLLIVSVESRINLTGALIDCSAGGEFSFAVEEDASVVRDRWNAAMQ